MKNKVRKTLALFLAVFAVLSLSACGQKGEDKPGYPGTAGLEGAALDAAVFMQDFVLSINEIEDQLGEALEYYATDEFTYFTVKGYMDAMEAYGLGMVGGYYTKSVAETDENVFVVRAQMSFGNTPVEAMMEMTLAEESHNYMTGEITYVPVAAEPVTFDKVPTVGEKMGNAGLNTLLGMGTVFIVLIIICLIIYLFGFINKAENRSKEKKNVAAPAVNVPAVEEIENISTNEPDDTELVAVIAAAIAMAEGTDPSGIRVRSIRKVGKANTWKRG